MRQDLFCTFVLERTHLIWLTIFVRCWAMSSRRSFFMGSSSCRYSTTLSGTRKVSRRKLQQKLRCQRIFRKNFLWDTLFSVDLERSRTGTSCSMALQVKGSGCEAHVRHDRESNWSPHPDVRRSVELREKRTRQGTQDIRFQSLVNNWSMSWRPSCHATCYGKQLVAARCFASHVQGGRALVCGTHL